MIGHTFYSPLKCAPARFGSTPTSLSPAVSPQKRETLPDIQCIPGSNPSLEFQMQVQKGLNQALSSFPRDIQRTLQNANLPLFVAKYSDDVFFTYRNLDALISTDYADHLVAQFRQKYPEKNHLSDQDIKWSFYTGIKENLIGNAACQLTGKGVIVFEYYQEQDRTLKKTQATFESLTGVIRHEIGHFLATHHQRINQGFDVHPDFKASVKQDFKNALKAGTLPLQHVDQTYHYPSGGQHLPFIHETNKPLVQTRRYFVPENASDFDRACREIFAESFAALYGGGGFPQPEYFIDALFPNATRFVRTQALPQIVKS